MKEPEQQNFGLYDQRLDKDSCGVGLITNINGDQSFELVSNALTMLENMEHRGACGFEPDSGDGAGILLKIPDTLFRSDVQESQMDLPAPGYYGVGMFFLPKEEELQQYCLDQIEKSCDENNFKIIYKREVKVDNAILGSSARSTEPLMMQIFVFSIHQLVLFSIVVHHNIIVCLHWWR